MMFKLATVLLALSSGAFASLFTTAPVATTSWAAGTPQTIAWQESTDGAKPTLGDMGLTRISVYVGNAQQQTLLQSVNASIDVSVASSITFTPDPTIGPNGAFYFIRYESVAGKDPTNPLIPALAFSAKFTLTGMTGTFSPAVSSQIAGASTAPLAAPPTAVATKTAGATTVTRGATATTSTRASTTANSTGAAVSSRGLSGLAVAAAAAVAGVVLF